MPFLCRACQRVGTDQEFFRHHISDRQVIIHPLDGSKPFELHRNRTSGDFHCIWYPCHYRECDSFLFKRHVALTCPYSKLHQVAGQNRR